MTCTNIEFQMDQLPCHHAMLYVTAVKYICTITAPSITQKTLYLTYEPVVHPTEAPQVRICLKK